MSNTGTTYQVTGMTCGGCARSMKGALERALPGIEVDISHAEDRVTVHGEHDASAVEKAVADAGFDFQGQR